MAAGRDAVDCSVKVRLGRCEMIGDNGTSAATPLGVLNQYFQICSRPELADFDEKGRDPRNGPHDLEIDSNDDVFLELSFSRDDFTE